MTSILKLMVPLAAALVLAACGGGGSDDDASTPSAASDGVPASASRSVPEMISWLAALGREDTEAKEPVKSDTFAPPAPDDAESSTLSS